LIGNVLLIQEDAEPIFPITIFRNDRLYSGVLMYLYCGKKICTEDTVYINGMRVGRKQIVEYALNSPYSGKKCKWRYESYGDVRAYLSERAFESVHSINVIDSLIHYVTGYFDTYEYSSINVERLQLDILNDLDERSGTLVSPYVIREVCKLYRII
jgi:hypothetical protein